MINDSSAELVDVILFEVPVFAFGVDLLLMIHELIFLLVTK